MTAALAGGNGMLTDHDLLPYRRLICAIIIQAVTDYQSVLMREGVAAAEASAVGRWFLAPDSANRANFHHLCAYLDKDPARLVARLNTRGLVREMREYQEALEKAYKRFQAQVAGSAA